MSSWLKTNKYTQESAMRMAMLSYMIAGVLFAFVAALVVSGVTRPFDQSVLLWINQHASSTYDSLFLVLTELGGVIIVGGVSLALTLYFVFKKKYYKAALIALSVGGVSLINILLKGLFDRPRPDLWEWLVTETSFSFPSGHSVASAALAFSIVVLLWRTKWRLTSLIVGPLYVLIVGASRMYLGVHYPTDVLGGWLLGVTWVSLVTGILIIVASYNQAKGRQS